MDKTNLPRIEIAKNLLYTAGTAFATLSFFVAILWFFDRPFWILNTRNYEPATVILAGLSAGCFAIGKSLIWMASRKEASTIGFTEEQSRRHRQAMLALVKNTWIDGYLKNSLHNEVIIRLGLKEKKSSVNRPFEMLLKTVDQADKPLPLGKSIFDVFQESNQSLLILGAPGSGKTTMLLEVTRELLLLAENDATIPIPVVFNLSSWKNLSLSFPEWLAAELKNQYFIPKKIARLWIENDQLLLLLDGLDEVAAEYREACVQVINTFLQDHLVPLVVCSRIADYDSLNTKLKLQTAVLLQPLTKQQIERYLNTLGPEIKTLQSVLTTDGELQELAETPLMLSIMALAYQDISAREIDVTGSEGTRRSRLFNAYIRTMLTYRSSDRDKSYSPKKIIYWLMWIAQMMVQFSHSIFLIEKIHPDCLPTTTLQNKLRLIFILVIGLFYGLTIGLFSGLTLGLTLGLIRGLAVGLLAGLPSGLFMMGTIGPVVFDKNFYGITLTDKLVFSWKNFKEGFWRRLNEWRIFFLAVGLFAGVYNVLLMDLFWGLFSGLTLGLTLGLFSGLLAGLNSGLSTEELKQKTIPNQGISLSTKNSLWLWLSTGLLTGLGIAALLALFFGLLGIRPALGLIGVLGAGLAGGLFGGGAIGLKNGGYTAILHYILRFILSAKSYLPWNLVRFLSHATELNFMRRVGGGYIFIHRMVMEHFANLTDGDIEKLASPKKINPT